MLGSVPLSLHIHRDRRDGTQRTRRILYWLCNGGSDRNSGCCRNCSCRLDLSFGRPTFIRRCSSSSSSSTTTSCDSLH